MTSESATPNTLPVDHYLSRDEVVYALDADAPPRLKILPGSIVTIETHDARGGRLRREDQVEETAPDFFERFPEQIPRPDRSTCRALLPAARSPSKFSTSISTLPASSSSSPTWALSGIFLPSPSRGFARFAMGRCISPISVFRVGRW